jgi:hypothetical protein
MSTQQLEQLVLDTLYERRMNRQGCFVDNAAGIELIGSNQDALSIIEQILEQMVEPVLCDSSENDRVAAIREQFRGRHGSLTDRMPIRSPDFPGLVYVVGAYLVIAAKSDPQRAVRFLDGRSAALKVEAVRAIPVFFKLMTNGYNFQTAPPLEYREFLRELASSDIQIIRSAAERALHFITWPA